MYHFRNHPWFGGAGLLDSLLGARDRGLPAPDGEAAARRPAADWRARDDAYVLRLELPGIAREGLEIAVDDGVLSVEARADGEDAEGGFPARHYRRDFQLPDDVDVDAIAASLADGLLELRLPKAETARRKSIPVR